MDGLSLDLQRACYGVWAYVTPLAWDQAFIVSAQDLRQVGERFAKSLELIIISARLVPNLSPVRVSQGPILAKKAGAKELIIRACPSAIILSDGELVACFQDK